MYNLEKIRSKYILKQIFDNLHPKVLLDIIHYNKKFQKKLEIKFEEFKKISYITEIELFLEENISSNFIKIRKGQEKYFKIYLNDDKEQTNKIKVYKRSKIKIKKVRIIIDYEKNITFYNLFRECKCIKKINFKKFNRNDIIGMSYMFAGCTSLKKINMSKFNTDNVTNMNNMFIGCESLEEINLSKFNTKNVKDMSFMFSGCKLLQKLDLSNFDTKNVTDMCYMFNRCNSLKELNLSNFNTNKVRNMIFMFCECTSLKELNLSNFKTDNLEYIRDMFSGCIQLRKLIIANFNFDKVKMMEHMFKNCKSINIICSDEFKMRIQIQIDIDNLFE